MFHNRINFDKLKAKNEFTRNVLTLMMGTTIAQAIPIAISPILTRIYSPKDFGLFALFMSITSFISVSATARYELAILLPKSEEEAINIVSLSMIFAILISLISLLVIFIFKAKIVDFFNNPEVSNWLYLIPLSVLLTGFYQSFNYWTNRKKNYKRLASNRVIQTTSTASANLLIGILSKFNGLILGQIIGQAIVTFILGKKIWQEDVNALKVVSTNMQITQLKTYKKFPLLNLPNAIIDGVRLVGIDTLITKFFTSSILGQYYLAFRMLQAPMSIIGSSFSQVFIQKIASVDKKEINVIVKKFISLSFIITVPIFSLIYFLAPLIFKIIFGKEWIIAGNIASILCPWIALNFISSPISNVYIVLNKQEYMLIFAILYMIIPLSIIYFYHDLGLITVLNYLSVVMSVLLIGFIFLAYLLSLRVKNG